MGRCNRHRRKGRDLREGARAPEMLHGRALSGEKTRIFQGSRDVVDKSLGTKRTCPACGKRFYDLNKDPVECPYCGETFTVEPILPSRQDTQEMKPEEAAPETVEEPMEELVSEGDELAAEDVEEAEAVADVDLGDVEDVPVDPDEGPFLEDDADAAPVDDIIPGAIEKDDEES
jgi:uncharacterized protein (TIGR02300 family)